jgi:type I restriction enzyme S subunit
MARLDEIFDLQMGKTPSRNNTGYWTDGQYDWVSIADLGTYQKYVEHTKEKISTSAVKESRIKIVPANTVIMSFKLSLGKTAITQGPVYTNEAIMAFIPTGKYAVLPDYFYYLFSAKDWTKGTNRAVMGTTLNKATLGAVSVTVPSLDKQRKIAAVLDKVSDLIAKRRQQLDKLDEMVKSRFVEMFGDVIQNTKLWPQYIFSDITTSRLGKMLDAKQQTGMCQYPYLANFNVQWFRFELDNLNKMDFNEADRIEFELRDGDLLVCEGGEIGRCAVWHNEIQPCYFQKALHRVRCKKEMVLPDYLAWWFKYNCDNKGFSAIEGAKATISHLPGAKLKTLLVSVPPIEQQNQFASFVEQTEKIKTTINKSLEKLETLKKALMQEYFGG